MDILHELEKSAKWSKINSYLYLSYLVFCILGVVFGIFVLMKSAVLGGAVLLIPGTLSVLFWIMRKVFLNYSYAAQDAMQSLSPQAIDEVCRCQRNIFIMYSAWYIIGLAIAAIAILIAIVWVGSLGAVVR